MAAFERKAAVHCLLQIQQQGSQKRQTNGTHRQLNQLPGLGLAKGFDGVEIVSASGASCANRGETQGFRRDEDARRNARRAGRRQNVAFFDGNTEGTVG